ncbi:pectinesterase family protein [Niabella insulamsoli]|uniref:pectinesterase family protein n=1 Tax=Niabella insulamsoli TaxID=3144874 RepID=UPI0031FCBBE9
MYLKIIFQLVLLLFAVNLFAAKPDFVVAQDGSGDFKTVQEAIDAVKDSSETRTVIYIKNGTYKEKLMLPATKTNVSFIGQDVSRVVLTYDDYASKKNEKGLNIGTTGSSSFFIFGDGFYAENITFENSAGPVGQAVAVRVSADRIRFKNCRFVGFQDTLYVHGAGEKSRQYYQNCYIEGTTDFIFGAATALFERCTIYCKKGGSYITAANTPKEASTGMVFLNCSITGDKGVSYYLGRPWGDYARTVFVKTTLPDFIRAEGWHNWGRPAAEQTVHYAEYKNSGPGAVIDQRVSWSKQLSKQEARRLTARHIFKGWDIKN